MSTSPLKDPDAIFEASGQQPLAFEDLTERAAVKLTSLLRLVARTNWPLFQENIIPNEQRTKTGLTAIIYRMELESTGNSVDLTKPAKVDVKISLAHAGEGKSRRIISVSDIGLWGNAIRENNYVLAARVYIHHVFTRPFGPPENRRVTELEAPLGFSKPYPDRKIEFLRPEDLLSPPEGLKPLHSDLADGEPHVWAYELTDLNQHVHAMDYVGTGITFAADQMARVGHPPGDYYFSRVRIIYRKPFFTGESFHRRGTLYEAPSREGKSLCFGMAYYKTAGAPSPDNPPCVALQLFTSPKPKGGITRF